MKIPTTLDRKNMKKGLKSPALAIVLVLLLVLSSLPVYAGEQQTEQTETPTVTEVTDSESAQKSEASGEQNQPLADELEPVQPIDTEEAALTANTDWTTTKPHEGEVLHGGYVGFKNKDSGKYLTIPGGSTASGTNVCQQGASTVANAQEFYLSYTYNTNKNVAYFTIFPVNPSTGNATTTRVKSAAISSGLANVSLQFFMPTESTDRWQIEHVEDNYYCIYLASNPGTTGTKYALTANSGNGTANGTSTTATGNVYVSAYTGADNQLWQICADGKPMDIKGHDISQYSIQETAIHTIVSYYYVPKAFNTSITWYALPDDMIASNGSGLVSPYQYGTMTITLSVYDASVMNYSLTNILYSIPEDNQEIYLSNAATGKYVDIAERSIQNNAVIEQQNYSSINSQQWRVCHDNNSIGYFRLMSVHSNKYLAIDQTNQSIVEQTDDSQSNYSLWKLDWTLTGNMILLCKATENNNMVLSLPVNNQGIGANLTMLTYTQDGNYNDEWYIIKNVISYVNYYDSTFSGEDSMIESISNANAFAHLVFARYYHVGFYMDGAAGQYATIADDCPTGVNTECSLDICGAVCYRNHHKYVQDISTQIYNSPREDNHIYVLWTNRADGTYCGNTIYQEHVTFEGTLAVVHSKRPVIHFLTIFDDPLEIDAYMSIVLAHETSHTLKMDDVYVVDGHDIDFDTKCIMERYDINTAYDFYLDVIVGNEKPFCNYCDQLMKNHTDNIVINGNVEED